MMTNMLMNLKTAKQTCMLLLILMSLVWTIYFITYHVTQANNTVVQTTEQTPTEQTYNIESAVADEFSQRKLSIQTQIQRRMTENHFLFPFVTCVKCHGGLGNNLFQYASTYGLARKIGLEVILEPDNPIYQFFRPIARIVTNTTVCLTAIPITERKSSSFEQAFFRLKPHADYRFQHYLQSWKYFHHVERELRQQLHFREDIISDAEMEIKIGLSHLIFSEKKERVYVGLHVRRGDLLTSYFIEFGYKVAEMTYINRAMKYFTLKYDNVVFFVLSNDSWWCKRYINHENVLFVENNRAEVDLAILSLLNHTIITVGTFGYWGAWLCGGETVYMKDFAVSGSELSKQFTDVSNYFSPGWIGL